MDVLRLSFEPDDEWQGELWADVSAAGFAGRGSAWFEIDELRQFVAAASAYPLEARNLPAISGGFGATTKAVEQVHLAIAFAPHDLRGNIRATVQLATQAWNFDAKELTSSVIVQFLVTYADLDRFSSAFRGLLSGENRQATLQSSAG